MSKFCMNCGAQMPDTAKFCPQCGAGAETAPAPEPAPPKETPAPEPEQPRKAEIPEYCPRCGKKTLSGYEHCTYCGTAWDAEIPEKLKAEPQKTRAAAEPTAWDVVRPAGSTDGSYRCFSWSYKRASMISRVARHHVEMVVELDDQRLRCTDSGKGWGPSVTETELPLKDISGITLGAKASFLCWVLVTLLGSAAVAFFLLPMLGVSVATGAGELMGAGLGLAFCCAIEAWWARFNLYHHRMVITGNGPGGYQEIVLEAKDLGTLQELQVELSQRTGVQPQQAEDHSAAIKAIFGAAIGIGIVALIVLFAADQNSQPRQTSSTRTGGTTSQTRPKTQTEDNGYNAVSERLGYDITELFGTWQETSYDYRNDMYAFIEIAENQNGKIGVRYVYPMANEYNGVLSIDDEDDLYSYMTSLYDTPGATFWFFYDGYGISALVYYDDGDTSTLYFEPV